MREYVIVREGVREGLLRGGAVPLKAVHERVEVVVKVVYRVSVEEEGRVMRGGRSEDEMGCALKDGMSRMGISRVL